MTDISGRPEQKPISADFFPNVRKLMRDCGPNKNDRANAVITACIIEGINRGGRILGVMHTLEFNRKHAGVTISRGITEGRWSKDDDGVYHLPD